MVCCFVRSVSDACCEAMSDNGVSSVLSTALPKYKKFPVTCGQISALLWSVLVTGAGPLPSGHLFHVSFGHMGIVSFAYVWAIHAEILSMPSSHILALSRVPFFSSNPSTDARQCIFLPPSLLSFHNVFQH